MSFIDQSLKKILQFDVFLFQPTRGFFKPPTSIAGWKLFAEFPNSKNIVPVHHGIFFRPAMFRFPEGKVSDSPRVIRFPKEKLSFLFLDRWSKKKKCIHLPALNRYIEISDVSPLPFDKKIGPKIWCEKFVNLEKLVFSMEKPIISTTRYQ